VLISPAQAAVLIVSIVYAFRSRLSESPYHESKFVFVVVRSASDLVLNE
jgi:hypothetical protein